MARNNELAADIHRIREILAAIHDPYARYQLTLLLEAAARMFVSDVTGIPGKALKGKRQCKITHNILPN
jgi:predicted Zn-dependent protease